MLSAALVMVATVACSEQPIGAAVVDTPREEWSPEQRVELLYENVDTLGRYNLAVVARIENGRAENPLGMKVECLSPTGVAFESNVVLQATESSKGGSFVAYGAEWIFGAHLHETGTYRFTFSPTESCHGVWSVGVTFEEP